MGNCLISIHVTGCHHNGISRDIDRLAEEFVADLKKTHNVTSATVVCGGEYDLTKSPMKEEVKS